MTSLHRFLALFRRAKLDREMDAEMRAHLEHETAQNIARGMSPDEARHAARRAFGGIERIQETERDARGLRWLDDFLRDLRHAIRGLRKSPTFTAVAVLSLALGIGANTAVFSILNGILLRSLPVPNPQELRFVEWTGSDYSLSGFSGRIEKKDGRSSSGTFAFATFEDFRARAADAADVFAFFPIANLATEANGEAGISNAMLVSGNYFRGYGARTAFGRTLKPEDDHSGADPVAVITYRFWKSRFDLDPDALGKTIGLNGNYFTIVGVLSPDYAWPMTGDAADVYVPMAAQPVLHPGWPLDSYDKWWVTVMARLAPQTNEARLHDELAAALARTLEQSKTRIQHADIVLRDGRQGIVVGRRYVAPSLYGLQAIVVTVLLIACANLAGLMLARAAARRREFAVCAAIGASRWRLMHRSLVESLLLALAGAGVGLLGGTWIKDALLGFMPNFGSEALHVDARMDLRVLFFALAAALVTALLCGLPPAWRAAGADPLRDMNGGRVKGPVRQRLGRVLVATQVALSVLLVAGAGLFVRSMGNLRAVNFGFDPQNLLLFQLNAHRAGYSEARRSEFFEAVRDRIARIPGVKAAAGSQQRLLSGFTYSAGYSILGQEQRAHEERQACVLTVSDVYFTTLDIPLRQGRDFAASDAKDGEPVVIINDQFANRHFPEGDPLGRSIRVYGRDYRIVGVCGSTIYGGIREGKPDILYLSSRQRVPDAMDFAVRCALPPSSVIPAIRSAVASIDPSIPLADISTQDDQIGRSLFFEHAFAILCGSLGGLAVALSCIGLYGLLAFNVNRRSAEIGVRMALGARPGDVARVILREALLMTLYGMAAGLPLAMGAGLAARRAFFGVTAYDPITMATVCGLLLLVAILAASLPALRAARVDPVVALRAE